MGLVLTTMPGESFDVGDVRVQVLVSGHGGAILNFNLPVSPGDLITMPGGRTVKILEARAGGVETCTTAPSTDKIMRNKRPHGWTPSNQRLMDRTNPGAE